MPGSPPSSPPLARLIDGRAIASQVRREVRAEVDAWTNRGHRPPFLAVVLVGDNPASASYVRGKAKAAAEAGIESDTLHFPADVPAQRIFDTLHGLNDDDEVDGILVQLPLPAHIDEQDVLCTVNPRKDVDGFHPENAGRLLTGMPGFVPATPSGILELLRRSDIETEGSHAVVVGRSNIVGRPLVNLLSRRGVDATTTLCHSRTRNLADLTHQADILVSAVGRPGFITADMVKKEAAVIDVGINRVEDDSRERGYRLVGDVDFENVRKKAAWITPVPGGVGPMTIAMLLSNTLRAAKQEA